MLERLLANWPLKLLSLALAVALWIAVTGEDHTVKDFTVPIDVQLPDDRILVATPPTNATVRIDGPESLIRELDPLGLTIRLDLRDVPFGERDVQLSEVHVGGIPSRASVVFIDPDRLSLSVDRRRRRELPVVADIEGEPPPGYALYQALVSPERVMVEGPASAVDALAHVRTNPIHVDRMTRAFTEKVAVVRERPQVRLLDPTPIEVRVVIDESPVEMSFDDVPVDLPEPATGTVSPSAARVTLTGPRSILERLPLARIRAIADLGAVEAGAQQVPVRADVVDLPPEQQWRVTVKSVNPHRVTVHLTDARPG